MEKVAAVRGPRIVRVVGLFVRVVGLSLLIFVFSVLLFLFHDYSLQEALDKSVARAASSTVTAPDNFDTSFDAAAKRLGLALRLEFQSCTPDKSECKYTAGAHLRVTVEGNASQNRTTEATFFRKEGGSDAEWDQARAVAMAVFSPDVSSSERARGLGILASQTPDASGQLYAPDVTYWQSGTSTSSILVAKEVRRRSWERQP